MEWVSGNILIRPVQLGSVGSAGVPEHVHNFDHTTIVFKGACRITAHLSDGSTRVVDKAAPGHVLIKAGIAHELQALEEGTEVWCVYAHRTPQGDVVQEWDGWLPAYR